ncbi:MAG TPA: DnaA/Hda family protein, partial [Gemmatimonadaceae bacterium]
FEGGLVVEMQSPDRELREKLYARFLSAADPAAHPTLLAYLAEWPAASVREVIGTVNRLLAAADLANVELSLDLARSELEPAGGTRPTAPTTVRAAADTFFLDDEKVLWDWPEVSARLIEELR